MRKIHRQYALCVQAEEDEDVLVRKLYEALPDELAAKRGYIRVIDESGEDYLYPAECFVLLDLPQKAERAFGPRSKPGLAKPANQAIQRTGKARR